MSDKKITDGDEAAANADKPLDNPEVIVRVKPVKHEVKKHMPTKTKEMVRKQNKENSGLAEKVAENLREKIEKDIEKAGSKPGGTRQDQYKALDDAANEAAKQLSRDKIDEIDVAVGDYNGDYHDTQVTPHEGTPPNDEED